MKQHFSNKIALYLWIGDQKNTSRFCPTTPKTLKHWFIYAFTALSYYRTVLMNWTMGNHWELWYSSFQSILLNIKKPSRQCGYKEMYFKISNCSSKIITFIPISICPFIALVLSTALSPPFFHPRMSNLVCFAVVTTLYFKEEMHN